MKVDTVSGLKPQPRLKR